MKAWEEALTRLGAQEFERLYGWYHRDLTTLRSTIESLEAQLGQAHDAIRWALGEGDSDFADDVPEQAPRYWWRKPLREKAGLVWSAGHLRSVRPDELRSTTQAREEGK